MKKLTFAVSFLLGTLLITAQQPSNTKTTTDSIAVSPKGHTNQKKFKQLYEEFATPNVYRNASGAPGHEYYQQQANYKMKLVLDDDNQKLTGNQTITYYNNSPDDLSFLWVQLDQNKRAKDSKTPLIQGSEMEAYSTPAQFSSTYLQEAFDGGFRIQSVKNKSGKDLAYTINSTMMRIDLPKPLRSGKKIKFSIDWWYPINLHVRGQDRSGYEYFKKDNNRSYLIAQFYPRMAVYNDVEGWQNAQFWGDGEFALNFGDFDVEITAPANHIIDATGELQNRKEVFTPKMLDRYQKALTSYDKPVQLISEEEAIENEKTTTKSSKTWHFKAQNVRDFALASSKKFIYEMMAVKLPSKTVMAVSLYPKEANPLWEEYSTNVVASTLKTYSRMTFDYPYHKAISVSFKDVGMEYPMICFNFGRPNERGIYSPRVRNAMIGVVAHEIGHNFFPMIVNSDERQWGWMDEGLNSFLEYLAEQEFEPNFPSRRGPVENIIEYMIGDQDNLTPIMTQADNVNQLGNNAYGKPATALNILRNTIMGKELFDHAFKVYANRWKFKHPTPEDFFRTMEEASAMDLDWFWRGWFYTTDVVDIGVKEVKKYYVSTAPNTTVRNILEQRGMSEKDLIPLVYTVSEDNKEDFKNVDPEKTIIENSTHLKDFLWNNFPEDERKKIKDPKFFYQITFEKPGGLVMPIIVRFEYADGSNETITYPARIWRMNDKEVKKVIASNKKIAKIIVDPKSETADINRSNNIWPKQAVSSRFDKFLE